MTATTVLTAAALGAVAGAVAGFVAGVFTHDVAWSPEPWSPALDSLRIIAYPSDRNPR